MNRYATQTSTTLAGLLAVATLIAFPAATHAAPTCEERPQIEGSVYVGTPCDDTIRMPRAVTVARGEGGDDTIYGQRGNDRLDGGEGNDRLYGGIGDDQLRGGPGDDLLSGGFGADSVLDGEAGNDFVRGDATIDNIQNSGGGTDTLSYATGVTPGFFDRQDEPHFYPDFSEYEGFPQTRDGRGAYVNLETGKGDNGRAPEGGGIEEQIVGAADFEIVIGTAFPDFIVGTGEAQTIYGGGGADVILGKGGGDEIYGGEEGDYCEAAGATTFECEFGGGDKEVDTRDPATVRVGVMAPQEVSEPGLYVTGSSGADTIVASYSDPDGPTTVVAFTVNGSPAGSFTLNEPPDSVVLAGLDGGDTLAASGFPAVTSIILLGGSGEDELLGGATEDALVDGSGDDMADAAAGDDAIPNNEGADDLDAGSGEDLFVSDAVCEGDSLDGGPGRDNANWANFDSPVVLDMSIERAGLVGTEGEPDCEGNPLTVLANLEDIEGTSAGDILIGDSGPNQLLGRSGPDRYYAAAGNDSILANSGTPGPDPDPTIDCGLDWDTAQIDRPENGPDAAPSGCESTHERDPNSFRPPDTPPDPDPPPAAPAPPPVPPVDVVQPRPPRLKDRTPPRTGIAHRPRKRVFATSRLRRVVFVFRSNERARFRCKLDRGRFRPCGARRVYRLRPGRHALRVFAIDRAGNRDRSPALFKFRVQRR